MSVVVVVICASCRLWHLQIILCSCFSQKYIFGELIVFRHLNIDFTIFLRVILSDLSKLSLSFKIKT